MPHQPDDDGFEPPLKVLRKRINGVYREDYGFAGPTRRYILMVAMLVGLASVPTLAVITAGTSEISGNGRKGAMDAPFLPPPASGPVRPSPPPQNHSGYDEPRASPSDSDAVPTVSPGVSSQHRTGDGAPAVPGLPPVPDDTSRSPSWSGPKRSDVDARDGSGDDVLRPAPVTDFPTVPGLPAVPDDDWDDSLARQAPPASGDSWDAPAPADFPDDEDSEDDGDSGDGDLSGSDDSSSDKSDFSDNADSSGEADADEDSTDDASSDTDADFDDSDFEDLDSEDLGSEDTDSEDSGSEDSGSDSDSDDSDSDDADSDDSGSGDPDHDDDAPHHECEAAVPQDTWSRRRSGRTTPATVHIGGDGPTFRSASRTGHPTGPTPAGGQQ